MSLLGILVSGCRRAEGEGRRARLIAEIGPVRLVEGRLSGFPYRPLGTLVKVSSQQARLIVTLESSSSATSLADLGVLLLADSERRGRSISLLKQAHERAPADSRIASDLSAACLASTDWKDFFLGLEAAKTAVDLSPELPEARFNLALALEKISLNEEAARAWNAFLALEDPRSGWAEEARNHLRKLELASRERGWQGALPALEKAAEEGNSEAVRRVVTTWRLRSRTFGEQVLLPRWGEARFSGDLRNAQIALTAARQIGEALSQIAGDAMLQDAVASIDQAAEQPDQSAALAKAHRDYGLAAQSYTHHDRTAAKRFARAERELAQAGSPFHLWAALFSAACDYQASRYEAALSRLDTLEGAAAGHYPNLAGRAAWIRGLIQLILERPLAARVSFRTALAVFERTGELGHQAAAHALLLEAEDFLGEEKQAWSHLSQALPLADDLEDPRTRQMIAVIATQMALQEGKPRVGLYFQNDDVRRALAVGNPVQIAYSLWDRASLDLLSGKQADARRDVAAASHWAARAGDEALSADILLLEARILAQDDIPAALAKLDATLPLLHKTQYVLSLSSAYLLRGRLHVRGGRRDLAAEDFQAGIEQVESTFGGLDDNSRLSFLDRKSELFDEMISLSARTEAEPWPTAFSYAERGRGQAIAQLLGGHLRAARPPTSRLAEVERDLLAGRALVEYSLLPDRLLGWVVRDGRTRSFSVPLGEAAVQAKVRRLTASIAAGGAADRPAQDLYKLLIAPLNLPPEMGLVIVPDKSLQEVPWSALRNAATSHALIEDHSLEITPSADVYLEPLPKRQSMAGPSASILIVADPELDPSLAGDLPRLPEAAAEAMKIGRLYGGADILLGKEATKKRVLAALGSHRIVHFGVHARIDGRSPLFSRLLLAPEPGEPGVLFARDLYGLMLPKTELVVLAACESASGQVADTEGVSSLARPFLVAGVPNVIGSLWRVDDRIAARFSTELHRFLRAGSSPADALQRAQMMMLRSRDPEERRIRSWAGFILYARAGSTQRRRAS